MSSTIAQNNYRGRGRQPRRGKIKNGGKNHENNGDTGKQIIIRNIPIELHREFKAICALEGKSLKDKIIELMAFTIGKGEGDKNE